MCQSKLTSLVEDWLFSYFFRATSNCSITLSISSLLFMVSNNFAPNMLKRVQALGRARKTKIGLISERLAASTIHCSAADHSLRQAPSERWESSTSVRSPARSPARRQPSEGCAPPHTRRHRSQPLLSALLFDLATKQHLGGKSNHHVVTCHHSAVFTLSWWCNIIYIVYLPVLKGKY